MLTELIFTTQPSLAWQFRKSREPQPCSASCPSCPSSMKVNQCFTKNAIYLIKCLTCDSIYIGQTSKCMRNRIYEHIHKSDSLVHQHFSLHPYPSFEWKIITTELNFYKRCTLEALHIANFSKKYKLINGCIGKELISF